MLAKGSAVSASSAVFRHVGCGARLDRVSRPVERECHAILGRRLYLDPRQQPSRPVERPGPRIDAPTTLQPDNFSRTTSPVGHVGQVGRTGGTAAVRLPSRSTYSCPPRIASSFVRTRRFKQRLCHPPRCVLTSETGSRHHRSARFIRRTPLILAAPCTRAQTRAAQEAVPPEP